MGAYSHTLLRQVLVELSADDALERFRLEYETLYRALKKSHESEKRLMKKCKELSVEIGTTNIKAATALKLSQEDQGVIQQLKKDIEKTWSAVEQSHEKETQTKETLATLRREIDHSRSAVERGAGSSIAQENKLRDLGATRDELSRDRDSHAQQVCFRLGWNWLPWLWVFALARILSRVEGAGAFIH